MGTISKRELNYMKTAHRNQMVENYSAKKETINCVYQEILRIKTKTIKEIDEIIFKKYKAHFDENLLKDLKGISSSKFEEISYIYLYKLALDNNDRIKELLYKAKLDLIESKKEEKIKKTIEAKERRQNKLEEKEAKRNDELKELNNIMDGVISGTKEIDKEQFNQKMQSIRLRLSEIDKDKYIDFLFALKNVNSISKEEINELLEVFEYFIKNLENNYNYLSDSNIPMKDRLEKGSKLKIAGEDTLDSLYKNNPNRLNNWRIDKLEKELNLYNNYKNMLLSIRDEENIDAANQLSAQDKKTLDTQEDFVKDFYSNYKNANDLYNKKIKKLNTIPPIQVDEMNDKFKKRLIRK